MGLLHYREFIKRGIVPFKDGKYLTDGTLEKTIDWIPRMSNIRYKDVPSFIRTTYLDDIMLDFMGEEAQNNLNAPAIIFNTFDALEHKVLEAITSKFNYPNIFTIGPFPLLAKYVPHDSPVQSLNSSLWKPDSSCLQWLDQKKEGYVIYVNYRSVTTMNDTHLIEFAWGLANRKQSFLWVVRPDVTMRDLAILPKEFLKETMDRGLMVSWCEQDQVLAHPSKKRCHILFFLHLIVGRKKKPPYRRTSHRRSLLPAQPPPIIISFQHRRFHEFNNFFLLKTTILLGFILSFLFFLVEQLHLSCFILIFRFLIVESLLIFLFLLNLDANVIKSLMMLFFILINNKFLLQCFKFMLKCHIFC
ncbi:linamarin synthase 1 [Lactuca sativa]|uniref:Uncharacterized protein n=1 Tax=Lactuca sativa TaxID=4236 RepID=A0A9R1WDJ6_LACSA|nr:linamarin synthase 1 [Lactuca sativa]KAJ0220631.1 hypothetical protein LSAT_V11C200074300 [Lactuca sativa]